MPFVLDLITSPADAFNMEVNGSFKGLYTVRNLAFISIFLVALFVVTFLAPKDVISACYARSPPVRAVEPEPKGDDLDAVLARAAGPPEKRKPVIIAVLNNAYVEAEGGELVVSMLDLFLESLWVGERTRPLIDNLLVAATDPTAYERCLFKRLHCYLLTSKTDESNLAGEKIFMSKGYINMTWTKVLFCLTVLQKGFDYIFTDVDIVWLRNPVEWLDKTDDIQFSTDQYFGDPRSLRNNINSGFYYVRSNNKTISLFQRWYDMRSDLKKSNQPVLRDVITGGAMKELNISGSFLDTRLFSGFCQESDDLGKVVTVHANCCRYISAKVKDLVVVLEDWKKFKGLPKNSVTSRPTWSKHANCLKSWE